MSFLILNPWASTTSDPIAPASTLPLKREPVQDALLSEGPSLHHELIEVDSIHAWIDALKEVRTSRICGLDLETTGLDPLSARVRLAQLALPSGRVYVTDAFSLPILEDLGRLIEDPAIKKVGHNLKFDLGFIQASQGHRLKMANLFDTMLASQVCWAGYYDLQKAPKATKNPFKKKSPEQTLKALAERHLGQTLFKELQVSDWAAEHLSPEQIAYAGMDAAVLLPLQGILEELIQKNKLEDLAELEFQALPAVVEMELQGLPLDVPSTRTMLTDKTALVHTLAQDLQEEAQRTGFKPKPKKGKKSSSLLNPDSSSDILDYLRSQGYKIDSSKEESLKEIDSSWAKKLLEYRRVSHQVKFLENWLLKLSPIDGRLHPGYFQLSTKSGRFSSREPNAQQVPKRGEDGLELRRLFKAPPGKKLIKGDFSGIELRIMARLSMDRTMINAFQHGQDLHKLTASKLAGVPLDQVTKAQRQSAKPANFGLIYGVSAPRFRENARNEYGIEMSVEEAEKVRQTFFGTYPGVAAWHQCQKALKRCPRSHWFHNNERGFYSSPLVMIQTLGGRKRVWGWHQGRPLARETELYNSPSQGTGADLLKAVMAEVYATLPEEIKMVGSVHDELILESPEALAQDTASKLLEIMRRVGSELLAPVPVDAEVEVLNTWGG
jgi:DNA polymerase I-like protein with 3'-5' exonuclease and polymerase domains